MPNKNDELELQKVFGALDALIKDTDINDVDAESAGFSDLPVGYYLCEVVKSELRKAKTSDNAQAFLSFKVLDDGLNINDDGDLIDIRNTKGKAVNKFYTFKDSDSFTRFVSDMLKFEGETPGEPLLPKQAFTDSRVIGEALQALVGSRVYINATETKGGGRWYNLMSWKSATKMGLPE